MLKPLRTTINEILAMAVQDLFPGVILGNGKVTSTQFFYEFYIPQGSHPELLAIVSEKMRQFIKSDLLIECIEMATASAVNYFDHHGQPVKAEAASEIGDPILPLIRMGKFYDILHSLPLTGSLAHVAFQLLESRSFKRDGYEWVEICGTAFESKAELKAFIKKKKLWQREKPWEAAERLDLMFYCEGVPVLLPKGVKIYQSLERFWRTAVKKQGLIEVIGSSAGHGLIAERLRAGVASFGAECSNVFGPSDLCSIPASLPELLKACISSLQFIDQTFNMLELSAEWVVFTRNPGSVHTKQWGYRVEALTKALKESGFSYSIDQDSVKANPTVELQILDSLGEQWAGPSLSIEDSRTSTLNAPPNATSNVTVIYSLLGPVKRLIALLAEQKVSPEQKVCKWL